MNENIFYFHSLEFFENQVELYRIRIFAPFFSLSIFTSFKFHSFFSSKFATFGNKVKMLSEPKHLVSNIDCFDVVADFWLFFFFFFVYILNRPMNCMKKFCTKSYIMLDVKLKMKRAREHYLHIYKKRSR